MDFIYSNGERLQKIADFYTDGGNIAELSRMIGYDRPQVLYDLMKGKTKQISLDMAEKITTAFPNVRMDFLLTGREPIFNDYASNQEIGSINEYEVPLLPVSAVGGTLSGFEVQVMGSDYEKIISPIKGADFAITVTGDSMAPEYPAGSRILIKKIHEKVFIDWGRTYVLDTINGIIIKNIFPSENGKILCRSINKEFPDFEIDLNDTVVFGVYRVLLCLSLK